MVINVEFVQTDTQIFVILHKKTAPNLSFGAERILPEHCSDFPFYRYYQYISVITFRFAVDYSPFCLAKHSLQSTGLSPFGSKGTFAI